MDASQFMLHYRLPEFSTPEECFSLLAKRMGLLRKGGLPNPIAAAKRILTDWNWYVFVLICTINCA